MQTCRNLKLLSCQLLKKIQLQKLEFVSLLTSKTGEVVNLFDYTFVLEPATGFVRPCFGRLKGTCVFIGLCLFFSFLLCPHRIFVLQCQGFLNNRHTWVTRSFFMLFAKFHLHISLSVVVKVSELCLGIFSLLTFIYSGCTRTFLNTRAIVIVYYVYGFFLVVSNGLR